MKQARADLGVSQSFVAHNLGISQGHYSKLENGKTCLSLTDWMIFCKLVRLDYNSIFYGHPVGLPKLDGEKSEFWKARFPKHPNIASILIKSVSH